VKKLKRFLIFHLIITLVLVRCSLAQIQYLELEGFLNEKNVMDAKFTITFEDLVNRFELMMFGRIYDFNYSSNAEAKCIVSSDEISLISCSLNLTPELRTLEIVFKTRDLVKKMDKNLVFKGDFSTNLNIDNSIIYVKLPEGFILSKKNKITPSNFRILSDGRRIIVTWESRNISKQQIQSFLIFYEPVKPFRSIFEKWYYLLLIPLTIFFFLTFIFCTGLGGCTCFRSIFFCFHFF